MPSENNKRIAKNTMYLYVRMLVVMAVSLFTVRIVLNALGAEDYGIYNVVGGVVAMFGFLSSTMNSASLRFFSFYLGRQDYTRLSDYFSMSFWCFVSLAVLLFVVAETLGLWFVKTQLVIPAGRADAAMWVYQCAIISFMFKIMTIPYNAIIIAREKMNVYAIGGLFEVFLKLGVAYILYITPLDKLKVNSVLVCLMTCSIDVFYIIYSLKYFPESWVRRFWDKGIFKEVVNYSGWSLFGAISGIIRSQGINILLNIFFNPVVNAARAIAYQVNSAINQFVLNFHKAVQPQITKYYAAGEKAEFYKLIFRSSRLYFYLIFLLSLPVLLETPYILALWLKNIPENTILFTRLVIIIAVIDSMSYPLQTSISATGHIKYFQRVTGGLLILNLPIAWFFLKIGCPPESTMYVAMGISIAAQVCRIIFSNRLSKLPISGYLNSVLKPILFVTILSLPFPIFLERIIENDFLRFLCVTIFSSFFTCGVIYVIGLTHRERAMLTAYIQAKSTIFKHGFGNKE